MTKMRINRTLQNVWHGLVTLLISLFGKISAIGIKKEPTAQIEAEETSQAYDRKILLATLANTQGIGYHSLRGIYPLLKSDYKTFTVSEIVSRLPQDLRNKKLVARTLRSPDINLLTSAKKHYDSHRLNGIQFYLDDENAFPATLHRIANPPYWLFVQGDISILHSKNIAAIVGTRKPSNHSLKVTRLLVEYLVDNNFVILSGLAQGIDYIAHITTIKNGGKTIAVLGHGMNVSLSKRSSKLRDEIVETKGAVITEYFPNVRYSRDTFVLRNRIQTGLSSTVIPIECRMRSGTAHTIRYAIEQKRRIYTITYEGIKEPLNDVYQLMKLYQKPIFNLPEDNKKMISYMSNDLEAATIAESNQQLPLGL